MKNTTANEIIKRIKEKRLEKELSYQQLADITKMSKSTLQRYETGEIENIPLHRLEVLANALGCTPAYLMGWEEENINIFDHPDIMPMPETRKVPRLGMIACGEPILADENIETYDNVPITIKCDFTLQCKGDSMVNARINDGDIVCIKEQQLVDNGQIAAILIDNEATLKRFYRYGDTVVLRAENPNFKDLEYRNEQLNDIRILGNATHFISTIR